MNNEFLTIFSPKPSRGVRLFAVVVARFKNKHMTAVVCGLGASNVHFHCDNMDDGGNPKVHALRDIRILQVSTE